jgi:hypothetical protein
MNAEPVAYELRPRADGEGYDLTGPLIAPRLWRVADYAEGYATMLADIRGGTVRVYGASGQLVRERTPRLRVG